MSIEAQENLTDWIIGACIMLAAMVGMALPALLLFGDMLP